MNVESKLVADCNRELKNSMEKLSDLAGIHDKQIIFLIIPSKTSFISSKSKELNYNKKLDTILEICSELSLICVNIKDSIQEPIDLIFYKEGHPNQRGHALIAKTLSQFIIHNDKISE